jgi:hypothetical protein
MLNQYIHKMLLLVRLEVHKAFFPQFASEDVAPGTSENGFSMSPTLSNPAAAENGCCVQVTKSDEYASRRVAGILPPRGVKKVSFHRSSGSVWAFGVLGGHWRLREKTFARLRSTRSPRQFLVICT